jgi:Family of unknown function (DUF5330)
MPKTPFLPGIQAPSCRAINADGEHLVSGLQPLWFRNGGFDENGLIQAPGSHLSKSRAESTHTNFRVLNLNANTYDLSRAVGKNCGIYSRAEIGERSREMFFLLRLAFWIGLVLVLLPRDQAPEPDKTPQLKASEAVSAATAAVSDMSQFCKRQPAACEVGGQAATMIGQRAQAGARKLYRIITDKRPPDRTGSIGATANANAAVAEAAARDTLTTDDMQIDWQGTPAP